MYFRAETLELTKLEQFSLCVAFDAKVHDISGVFVAALVDTSGECISSIFSVNQTRPGKLIFCSS